MKRAKAHSSEPWSAEYRIEKQFLKQQYSRLSRREEGEWALVAENDEADKQTRGLLDAIAPARGAAQAAHWGLLAYLWSRQGMAAAWPELKGEAGESVRHELAAVDLDPVLDAMVKKLDEKVEKRLTKGGAPKAHGPLKIAETACEEHTQELEEITEKLSELRGKREAQQTASGERSKLESELEKRKESLKTLEAQAEVIRNALKRVEELTKEKKPVTNNSRKLPVLTRD